MHISILQSRFEAIGCRGVADFAKAIKDKRYRTLPMAHIRRNYGNEAAVCCTGGNTLYTVEHYLSDLLSRVRRLDRERFKLTNDTLRAFAQKIRDETLTQ